MRVISNDGTVSVNFDCGVVSIHDNYIHFDCECKMLCLGRYESHEDAVKAFKRMHKAHENGARLIDLSTM